MPKITLDLTVAELTWLDAYLDSAATAADISDATVADEVYDKFLTACAKLPDKQTGNLRVHRSVTLDRVVGAALRYSNSLDNPGICLTCGADADGCEPDAERYKCEACGEKQVYGAEQLLMMGVGHNK